MKYRKTWKADRLQERFYKTVAHNIRQNMVRQKLMKLADRKRKFYQDYAKESMSKIDYAKDKLYRKYRQWDAVYKFLYWL